MIKKLLLAGALALTFLTARVTNSQAQCTGGGQTLNGASDDFVQATNYYGVYGYTTTGVYTTTRVDTALQVDATTSTGAYKPFGVTFAKPLDLSTNATVSFTAYNASAAPVYISVAMVDTAGFNIQYLADTSVVGTPTDNSYKKQAIDTLAAGSSQTLTFNLTNGFRVGYSLNAQGVLVQYACDNPNGWFYNCPTLTRDSISYTAINSVNITFNAGGTAFTGTVYISDLVIGANTGACLTLPPVTTITIPTQDTTVTVASSVNFTAAVTSSSTIQNVSFYTGGDTLLGSATTAPYQFTWSSVPNGTHVVTARATDINGQTDTSATVTITTSGITGVTAAAATAATSVFPNPTISGVANYNVAVSGAITATLADMTGKVVAVQNGTSGSFDVSGLNKGVYVVSFALNGAYYSSQKLVVSGN